MLAWSGTIGLILLSLLTAGTLSVSVSTAMIVCALLLLGFVAGLVTVANRDDV